MEKILRAAMVGIGSMGRGHLDNYLRLEKEGYPIKVVALCDIDEKKFTNYKADFNIGEVGADGYDFASYNLYTDLEEMLKNEELDMVTIALPTYLHCWGTCLCLEAGVNVICEKPMAPSVEDCNKMIETARRTGKNLMIGQCLRFAGQYDTVKSFVDSGIYGKAYSAFFFRGGGPPLWSYENWLLKREKGGGALFDQHVHDVDAVNHIFGMPKAVTTNGYTVFPESAYDCCTTNYIYEDMMPVNAQNDWTMKGNGFYQIFRVNFEKATVWFDENGLRVIDTEGKDVTPDYDKEHFYYVELKYFADTLRAGGKIERATPESARDTVKIALAEMESADKHGEIVYIK